MRKQLLPALIAFVALSLLCGVVYPLVVTGIAQVALSAPADGSLVKRDGKVVGSSLIGQQFSGARWFHARPSAAGDGYDALASAASNLGPSNASLIDDVRRGTRQYRAENELAASADVPPDAVTSSGSGLDPHISPTNARLQAPRVARERGLDLPIVLSLVDEHTSGRSLGVLGEPTVNVLELNLALDSVR